MLEYPLPQDTDHGLHRVVFDFDGVLAEDVWPLPDCGPPIYAGIDMLKHYSELGFECVILTSRPSDHKQMLWSWVHKHGLTDIVYAIITDKPAGWLYIDDRGFRFER